MQNDRKLGRAVNIFCCILVIFIFEVRQLLSDTVPFVGKVILTILLVIIAIALILADVYRDEYPELVKIGIVAIYLGLCVLSIIINGSNNMFFLLIMLSTGIVALLFDKKMFLIYLVASQVMVFGTIPLYFLGYENVFAPLDFGTNILCLIVEDIIVYNIQRILFERDDEQQENKRTVDELLRVIDAKREDALGATKSKSDFLASMSHEIRTPINAVLGLNEMILRESAEKETLEYAQDIRSAGNSLLALVNDILDFSKIEAGKMELHPVVYDLGNLLNDLINIISMRAANKGLSFQLDIDPSIPHVLVGDEVRIKQIISNILTNAVKYTNEGKVELSVLYEKLDEYRIEMTVSVSDTGQGMKPEDLAKLYKPFERIEEVRNRHVEGTGLGMTLTRNLLNMMGSEIEIESVYGEGSTFSFKLKQDVENWEGIGSLDEALKRVKAESTEEHEYFLAPDANVLVVDDMPLNLKVFANLLKRTQINIETAESGLEALSLVRRNSYDLIFLDHMMPGMDGIETLHKMQTDRFNINRYETPVIVLTANAVSGAREKYIEEGFTDYLTKPIDSGMLEAMVVKYLKAEKVITGVTDSKEIHSVASSKEETIIEKLDRIPGIDAQTGFDFSGDEEIYTEIVKEYTVTIEAYSNTIEKYYREEDIRNYTIQVHALKSSSKLVGAMELSDLAASLEKAGNDGDLDLIKANTDRLLQMYRDLLEPLQQALEIEKNENDDREEIDNSMLCEALMAIKEGIDIFDFDLIDSVMSDLDSYKMPEDFKEDYDNLKVLIAQVDTEAMLTLINGRLEKME